MSSISSWNPGIILHIRTCNYFLIVSLALKSLSPQIFKAYVEKVMIKLQEKVDRSQNRGGDTL